MKGRIVVFSIVGCPHCLRAKNRLADLDLPYSDVNLDSFPQVTSPFTLGRPVKLPINSISMRGHGL